MIPTAVALILVLARGLTEVALHLARVAVVVKEALGAVVQRIQTVPHLVNTTPFTSAQLGMPHALRTLKILV